MRRLVLLCLLALALRPAAAATISCVAEAAAAVAPAGFYPSGRVPAETSCVAAELEGPIRDGDAAKLHALLTANAPFLGDLYLNAPGGDAAEAMRIGALVRRLRLSVSAPFWRPHGGEAELVAVAGSTVFELCSDRPEACGCADACVLVWAAGGRRNGDALRPVSATAAIRDYLAAMQAPAVLAGAGQGAGWLNAASVAGTQYPAEIADWLAATCGTYDEAARDRLLRDVAAAHARRGGDAAQLDRDHEAIATVQHCRDRMFARHRDEAEP